MKEILTSATKIVFLMMAFATIGLTYIGKVSPEKFMEIVMMVFLFYYSRPTNDKPSNTPSGTNSSL